MGGGERVFPAALAALEGLHKSSGTMHSFFQHSHVFFGARRPIRATKSPFSSPEKRSENPRRLFPSFLAPLPVQAGIGTWSLQLALQPVAVVSQGQSLNHSR